MEMSWPTFVGLVAGLYLVVNLAFGLVYAAIPGSILNARPHSVVDGFFFSVDTLGTVGYGGMTPATHLAHAIASVEILAGLFFSATMPADIRALAGELLHEPVEVSVTPAAKTADRVEHNVLFVEAAKKRDLLVELFDDTELTRVIVFTRTKRGADRVARALDEAGVDASAIHGNKSQGQRERALAAWEHSRLGPRRQLIASLKLLAMLHFYERPEAWAGIGFDETHLRAKLLAGPNAAAHAARLGVAS